MRLQRAASHRRMPWKNGGGVTTEIAVHPEGAGVGDFAWRVSMARVEADGPFSSFPGVDRSLAILEGDGMRLEIDGCEPVVLTVESPPFLFAADAATSAQLVDGPIVDLNVMTRRTDWTHSVEHRKTELAFEIDAGSDVTLLFCQLGSVTIDAALESAVLDAGDCLEIPPQADKMLVTPTGVATLFLIRLGAVVAPG